MAAKKIKAVLKLQIEAGAATPAPPVGPALGQAGVNIMEFVQQYNAKTADKRGQVIPVIITVYEDRTFTFVTKTPPTSSLITKALNIPKGSGEPNKKKVGKLTQKQLEEIAKTKQADLNANDLNAAVNIIAGTCRSMGVTVAG